MSLPSSINIDRWSGKIKTNNLNVVNNIYACGDIVHGNKELTPVNIND